MKNLSLYTTKDVEDLATPDESICDGLETSALLFFTDFRRVKPLVIDSSMSAIEVKKMMSKAHVHLKLLLDEKGHFVGVITSEDLIDRRLIQKVAEGDARESIAVTDLMTPKRALKALDYNEVARSSIADVIRILKDSGARHCLVIDSDPKVIRGVFSASEISKKLQLPIEIQEKSSFYKVFSATANKQW